MVRGSALAIESHNYYNQFDTHRGAIHCINEAEIALLPLNGESRDP